MKKIFALLLVIGMLFTGPMSLSASAGDDSNDFEDWQDAWPVSV